MSKLVSVIIPCYNGEMVIDRSIQSVYNQTYSNIELIVVDDGSTDDSKNRILLWKDKFEKKGYVLKYIYQNNCGLGGAINKGLKYITGVYLTLLDADDKFLPESIEKRVHFLESNTDYSLVRSNGWMVKDESKVLFVQEESEKNLTNIFDAIVSGTTNNWAGTYMVRTDDLFSFYSDRNIYPSRFGQNLQILMPVSYKKLSGFIDEPLMEYIIQPNSLSQSENRKFEKEELNSKGYKEIYIYMINLIVKNANENKRYMNEFYASYYRASLRRYARYNKFDLLDKYYKLLVSTGLVTLNDKIEYYTAKKSVISIILRIVRRLKSYLKI